MNHTLKSSRYIDAPLFLRIDLLRLNWDNALLEGRNKPSYHVKGEKHPDGSYFLAPPPAQPQPTPAPDPRWLLISNS